MTPLFAQFLFVVIPLLLAVAAGHGTEPLAVRAVVEHRIRR
jgi:hypothetical protein